MKTWHTVACAAAAFCLGYLTHGLTSAPRTGSSHHSAAEEQPDARYFTVLNKKTKHDCPARGATKVLVALGQSNSANSAGHRSADATGHIFNWFGGNCYTAADPLLGATGDSGSIWIAVADQLLRGGFAENIVIVPLAIGGTSVTDWQSGSEAGKRLDATLAALAEAGLDVDLFLWLQGERDVAMNDREYSELLGRVIDRVLARFPKARFGISGTSYCRGESNPKLVAAQQAMPHLRTSTFYLGSTDDFSAAEERYDDCHFSPNGVQKVAALFAKNILNAAR